MITEHKLEAMVENIGDFVIREDRMPLLSEIGELIGKSKTTVLAWLNEARAKNLIDWHKADRFYYIRGVYFEDKRIGSDIYHNDSDNVFGNPTDNSPLQG